MSREHRIKGLRERQDHPTRRGFIKATSALAVAAMCRPVFAAEPDDPAIAARVEDFFANNLIIDGVVQNAPKDGNSIRTPGETKKLTGINASFMTLKTHQLTEMAERYDKNTECYRLIRSASDLDEAYASGRHAVGLYVQSGLDLTEDLDQLRTWYQQGLRCLQIAYDDVNSLGAGANDDETPLSPLGHDVVKLCEELGITVDVSHCGKRTTLDVAKVARKPITANHCNAEAVCKSRRNKSDAELRAIAATGGVVGVMTINCFLTLKGKAEVDDFCDHVEYMARRFGMKHVGVASDSMMDGGNIADRYECGPSLYCYERWANVAANLFKRGFKEEHLAQIFGQNFKRVYDETLG